MAIAVSDGGIESSASGSRRWGACFAAILALHVAGLWLALTFWHETEPLPAGPPAIAMVELAPLPVAPSVVTPAPPPEPVPPLPPPREETAPPTPAPIITVPLPPKPKPVMKRPPPRRAPPPVTATPAPVEVSPAPMPPAVAAPRPSNAVPTWQSAVLARIEQFKRYPNLAEFRHQQGVVYLRFTMDRQGQVLSAQIAKSSGYDSLDDAALALIHRAEPLPPPPAEVPGETLALTVPVQYFLK